jgi:hypothetical protein
MSEGTITKKDATIQSWRNYKLLHPSVILPVVMTVAFIAIPLPYSFIFLFGLFLFHMHICMTLTYDGFMRMSRYRLSQNHPILDKIVSLAFIVLCFVGGSPLVLFLRAYSLYISKTEKDVDRMPEAWWNRVFMIPLVQGVVLAIAMGSILPRVYTYGSAVIETMLN